MTSRFPPIGFASPRSGADPDFEAGSRVSDGPGPGEADGEVRSAEAVLASAPDGVFVVDAARRIRFVNAALERMTGHPAADLLGAPVSRLLAEGDGRDRFAEALRSESGHPLHVELRCAGGRHASASVAVSPLQLPSGRRHGIVVYARHASDGSRVQQELERKNAELEHYVDAVSHDLRSPLMSLLGFSRLLDEDYGQLLDDKGRHFLRRIQEAGRSMEDLIGSLLELSRMGRTGPSEERVDPHEVLLQLQAELKPRLDESGATLVLPSDMPRVRCQRTRLYQALSNLIVNALDHADTPSPRIEVKIDVDGDAHVIRVCDNGVGIPPEHHERIFEMFHSLGPRRSGARGNGMGLAIVSKAAEIQGGRAWVESAPGQGTTFSISLPRS